MNFLAHAYLSGSDENLIVGNFIADFIKGKRALEDFSPAIREGIYLHRAIDAFTDTHPIVSISKNRLRVKYRHYASVIVDVFYDHFLANEWDSFHQIGLKDFTKTFYDVLQRHRHSLPERSQHMLPYMIRQNWLLAYASINGISEALGGMSRRTAFDSRMDEAVEELQRFYPEFQSEFRAFFPELVQHAQAFISLNVGQNEKTD
jgi:acyl carrier protein phosphodiesterase